MCKKIGGKEARNERKLKNDLVWANSGLGDSKVVRTAPSVVMKYD